MSRAAVNSLAYSRMLNCVKAHPQAAIRKAARQGPRLGESLARGTTFQSVLGISGMTLKVPKALRERQNSPQNSSSSVE